MPILDSGVVTSEALTPIVGSISSCVGVILPVGICIFGVFLAVHVIPSLILRFLNSEAD